MAKKLLVVWRGAGLLGGGARSPILAAVHFHS